MTLKKAPEASAFCFLHASSSGAAMSDEHTTSCLHRDEQQHPRHTLSSLHCTALKPARDGASHLRPPRCTRAREHARHSGSTPTCSREHARRPGFTGPMHSCVCPAGHLSSPGHGRESARPITALLRAVATQPPRATLPMRVCTGWALRQPGAARRPACSCRVPRGTPAPFLSLDKTFDVLSCI